MSEHLLVCIFGCGQRQVRKRLLEDGGYACRCRSCGGTRYVFRPRPLGAAFLLPTVHFTAPPPIDLDPDWLEGAA